jgi:hypothetical protein
MDRGRWRAVVNTVMNIWVHKMSGISQLAENINFAKTLLDGVNRICVSFAVTYGDLQTGYVVM